MKTRVVIAFVFGFAGAELLHIWREKAGQHVAPLRPYALVMVDIGHAIPELVGNGVYWFDGSFEDARQLNDIVKVLQPNLMVSVMKVKGIPDIAIINAQHSIFGNGEMLLREVEEKLTVLAPANN